MPKSEICPTCGSPLDKKPDAAARFAELAGPIPLSLWRYWELPASLICLLMAWAATRVHLPPGFSNHWHLLGYLGIVVAIVWFVAAVFRRRDEA